MKFTLTLLSALAVGAATADSVNSMLRTRHRLQARAMLESKSSSFQFATSGKDIYCDQKKCSDPSGWTCPSASECVDPYAHKAQGTAFGAGLSAAGKVSSMVGSTLPKILEKTLKVGSKALKAAPAVGIVFQIAGGFISMVGENENKCDNVCVWGLMKDFVLDTVHSEIEKAKMDFLKNELEGAIAKLKEVDTTYVHSKNYPDGPPPDRYWSELDAAALSMTSAAEQFLSTTSPSRSAVLLGHFATIHIGVYTALLGSPSIHYANEGTRYRFLNRLDTYISAVESQVQKNIADRKKAFGEGLKATGSDEGLGEKLFEATDEYKGEATAPGTAAAKQCVWTMKAPRAMAHTYCQPQNGETVDIDFCEEYETAARKCWEGHTAEVMEGLNKFWKGTLEAVEEWKKVRVMVEKARFPKDSLVEPCTADAEDPYASGEFVPCCAGSKWGKLGKWDGDGRNYYKCQASM